MSDTLRILVVEDNPADADFIHEMLPDTGAVKFQIESVARLAEAITRLERRDIDLVLLDLGLPDSQGLATFNRLRQAAPGVPVIVLTGNDDEGLAVAALRDGAQDYLVKGQVNGSLLTRTARYAHERQRGANDLAASEVRYRGLFESSKDGILVLDGESGMVMEVNPYLLKRLGCSREDFVGKKAWELGFLKEIFARQEQFTELQQQEYQHFDDKSLCSADGRRIDVEFVSNRSLVGSQLMIQCNFRDISERKLAEAALRESEARLKLALETSQSGVWDLNLVDHTARRTLLHDRIFGYETLQPSWTFEIFLGHILPEDRPEVKRRFQEAIATQSDLNFECRIRRTDGEVRWISVAGGPMKNLEGKVVGMSGLVKDTTERKQVEGALQHNQDMLARTEHIAQVGSWEWEVATDTVKWSEELFRMFQRNPADGAPSFAEHPSLYHRDDMAHLQRAVEAAVHEGRAYELELRTNRADGETRICLARGQAEMGPDGKATRLFGSLQDITERKRAELALAQSESEQRNLAKILTMAQQVGNVGSWDTDLATQEVKWSGQTHRIFETTPETFKPTHAAFLEFIPPDDREAVNTAFLASADSRAPCSIEHRIVMRDGRIKHVEERWQTFVNAENHPVQAIGACHDITERKLAETALRRSEADLQRAQETAHIGNWSLDLPKNFVTWSAEMYRIFGTTPDLFDHTPEGIAKLIHPEDAARQFKAIETLQQGRTFEPFEYRAVRRDGEIRVVHVFACEMERDAAGQPVRVFGAVQDITERRLAETYNAMGQEILQILNVSGSLRDVIQRVVTEIQARTGFDAVGIRLQDGEDFPYFSQQGFPEEFLATENTLIARSAEGGICRNKDGTACLECTCGLVISGRTDPANPLFTRRGSCWTNNSFPLLDLPASKDPRLHPRNRCIHQGYASVALVPIRDQERIVGLIQLNDRRKGCFTLATVELLEGIAAHLGAALMRQQADARIREQAALLDKVDDAVYVRAPSGEILYWNQGAERLYGWPAAEVIGHKLQDFNLSEVSQQGQLESTLTRTGGWTGEKQQLARDGRKLTVFCRITSGKGTEGYPDVVIAINTDITEKKQIEARFLQAQRLESLGALASGLAHDLNNVLAPILMATAILKDRLPSDAERRMLAIMEASAQRGADIVRQVLTFASGVKGERMPVHLRHLLREMVDIAAGTFPPDIKVELEAPKNLWPALGDVTQLHQILMNLCINARDAMPQGGRLTLSAENLELDEAFAAMTPGAKPGQFVCLKVTDTGTGISLENQAKIFEPFFTTKEQGKGTGLGLATVLGITKGHGGFLRLHSTPGRGTSFEVYLPASPEAELPAEGTGRMAPARGDGQIILVVDDEAAIRTVATQILEKHGYRSVSASDGSEAMAVYVQQAGAIAAVITDMVMPGMDGPMLIRTLRRIAPQLPILGMTGFGEHVGLKTYDALALPALLIKPFTADKFLTTLHAVLHAPPGTKAGASGSPWRKAGVPPAEVVA